MPLLWITKNMRRSLSGLWLKHCIAKIKRSRLQFSKKEPGYIFFPNLSEGGAKVWLMFRLPKSPADQIAFRNPWPKMFCKMSTSPILLEQPIPQSVHKLSNHGIQRCFGFCRHFLLPSHSYWFLKVCFLPPTFICVTNLFSGESSFSSLVPRISVHPTTRSAWTRRCCLRAWWREPSIFIPRTTLTLTSRRCAIAIFTTNNQIQIIWVW